VLKGRDEQEIQLFAVDSDLPCLSADIVVQVIWMLQGGHKPGKPGILRDFSEHGKLGILREFCATSGENCNKQSIFSSSFKYLVRVQ